MIIDAHLHVWRATPADQPAATTLVGPHEDVPIERALAVFDANAVDRGVLVQPMYPGEDNSYVADCAAERPHRLAAVCVVDPRIPGADDRLEHWVVARGCRGLRLRPRFPEESAVFGDPRTFPLWARAGALGVPVNLLANPEHIATIARLAAQFPEVDILIDHLAHPDVAAGVGAPLFQALLNLAEHPRVSIKVSGYYHFSKEPDPYRGSWDLIHAVYDRFGPRRMIWGSDFPHAERMTGYARTLALIEYDLPFLNNADRALILGANAARLYWPDHTRTS
jgi:L-fuconolactonase